MYIEDITPIEEIKHDVEELEDIVLRPEVEELGPISYRNPTYGVVWLGW